MGKTQSERTTKYRASARGKFSVHKINAKQRGIEFLLTFEQWHRIWLDSGYYDQMGNTAGKYNMCRLNDEGAYSEGNVYIGPWTYNAMDGLKKIVRSRREE